MPGAGFTGACWRLLLLTDGQANVGPRRGSDVGPLVGAAWECGISTSCIGLGEDYDERLLGAMAAAGQGNLVPITAPQQLEAVFTAELEGLQLVIGRQLQLRLQPGLGVDLTQVHNPLEANIEGWIDLGDLQAGSSPSLALGLQLAPRPWDGPTVVELALHERALLACGRLDGVSSLLPDPGGSSTPKCGARLCSPHRSRASSRPSAICCSLSWSKPLGFV